MAQYQIQDDGEQLLTPGTVAIRAQGTAIPADIGFGNAHPTNWYHLGLFRFSVQGWFARVIPMDATFCYLPAPTGATSLAYSLTPGARVTLTEIPAPTGPTGNPQEITRFFNGTVTNPPQTLWTYTVPANRTARISLAQLVIPSSPAPGAWALIQSGSVWLVLIYAPTGSQQAPWFQSQLPYAISLFPGDQIVASSQGPANSSLTIQAALWGVEYDFATFVP